MVRLHSVLSKDKDVDDGIFTKDVRNIIVDDLCIVKCEGVVIIGGSSTVFLCCN